MRRLLLLPQKLIGQRPVDTRNHVNTPSTARGCIHTQRAYNWGIINVYVTFLDVVTVHEARSWKQVSDSYQQAVAMANPSIKKSITTADRMVMKAWLIESPYLRNTGTAHARHGATAVVHCPMHRHAAIC
jgi:hypothetical protein